jgi:heme/copper-type cytochrome/quinol oxidase subunit 2
MNSKGAAILAATFVIMLVAPVMGFLVVRTYTPPTSASPPVVPEVRQFSIHMHATKAGEVTMHHWVPSTIVVNAGDTVILKVTNGDPDNAHGFSLGALNIGASAILPGQAETFRFRATHPGIYQYQCRLFGCARDHADQVGQLVVLGR